jgi:hypothetical protein
MSKINTFESASLALFFNNVSMPFNIGGAAGTGIISSSASGSLWVSLHTADPGETGAQNTSEATYTGYARVAVSRSFSGWVVTGSDVFNSSSVTFPAPTAGSSTIIYWGIGTGSAGAGQLLYRGPISSNPIGFALGESTDDTLTIKNHALGVSDRVAVFSLANLSLPGNITEGTVYFVKTVPSADTITISGTDGGPTLDITSDGQGLAYKILPYTTTVGIQPQFAPGALRITED